MSKKAGRYTNDILSRPGMVFAVEVKDPKARVQAYLDSYKNDPQTETFDAALMKHHLKLLSATAEPKVTTTFRMKVTQDFCSTMGNMHGGAIALVLDMCTTTCMAPVSTPDFWLFGGVSRTLNTTFLRAIKQGTEIEVFCEVLHVGARLAAIRGEIRDCADGKLFVVGEHNKASISFEKRL